MLLRTGYTQVNLSYNEYYAGGPTSDTTVGGWHPGIDYRAQTPLPVYSPVSGNVSSTSTVNGRVSILIDGTNDYFIFLHLSSFNGLAAGSRVEIGNRIGTSGSVDAAAPHLHIETRTGREQAAYYFTTGTNTGFNKNPLDVADKFPVPSIPTTAMRTLPDLGFDWATVTGATGYRIQIATSPSGWTAANGFTSSSTTNSIVVVNAALNSSNNPDGAGGLKSSYVWGSGSTGAGALPVAGQQYWWTVRSNVGAATYTNPVAGSPDTYSPITAISGATDTTPPSVAISTPASGASFTNPSISFSGTASDNIGVSEVQYRHNSGSWLSGSGTTSWSASITLTEGGNTLEARSRDAAGNYSTIASRSVTYNAPTVTYLNGLDVSRHNINLNWSAAYSAGYRYAYVKATDGHTWSGAVDPLFHSHRQGAEAAGLVVGFYHYAEVDQNPTLEGARLEAQNFYSVVGSYLTSTRLRPALDIEEGASLGKTGLSNWTLEWINEFVRLSGVAPIIYCNQNYENNYLNSNLTSYPLWCARYSTSAPDLTTWPSWTIWQHTSTGAIPNFGDDTVDLNRFQGTLAQLQSVLGITPVSQPALRVTSSPTATPYPIVRNQSVQVQVSVQNTGSASFVGELAMALHDADGNFLTDIGAIKSVSIGIGVSQNLTYTLPSGLWNAAGWYQLWLKQRPSGGGWSLVNAGSYSNPRDAEIVEGTVPPSAPTAASASSVTSTSFTANWGSVSGATGYRLDVSNGSSFSSFVSGYNNLDVGNVAGRSVSGLTNGATYYYRVRAYNAAGTSGNSGTISVPLVAVPTDDPYEDNDTRATATNISGNETVWHSGLVQRDADWYQIAVTPGNTRILVDCRFLHAEGDTEIRLISSSGAILATSNGSMDNEYIDRDVALDGINSGTLYIQVYGADQGGAYMLWWADVMPTVSPPAAPVAGSASSVTSTSFTANWGSVSGANGYRLDVSASSSFGSFVSGYNNLDVTSTSRSVTGLTAGATYYYRVRAYNAGGTSGNSGTISVPLVAVPTDDGYEDNDTLATATNISGNETVLHGGLIQRDNDWYRIAVTPGDTRIQVYCDFLHAEGDTDIWLTDGSGNFLAGSTGTGDGEFIDYDVAQNGINSGALYIVVYGSNLGGAYALWWDDLTPTVSPPAAPVATVASSVATSSFTANWNAAGGATGYRLDVSSNSSFSGFVSGYNNLDVGNVANRSVSGLTAGATYYYRVRAYNAGGTSGNSGTISVPLAVPTDDGYEDNDTLATATNISSGESVWHNGLVQRDSDWYRIEVTPGDTRIQVHCDFLHAYGDTDIWLTDGSGNILSASTGYGNGEDIDHDVAQNGITSGALYLHVYGADLGGVYDLWWDDVTSTVTPPAAPVATAGSGATTSSFTANWNAVSGATGYRLDVSASSSFSNFVSGYNDLDMTATSLSVSGLYPGTTYYYRVRAYNGAGTSGNSNIVSTTTGATWAPDLRDGGTSSHWLSHSFGNVGQSIAISSIVRNDGMAASGAFTVKVYASTDPTISSSDILLATVEMAGVGVNSHADMDVFTTLPAGLEAGSFYYIGWIIDSGNTVAESDEANNVVQTELYLTVIPPQSDTISPTLTVTTPASNGMVVTTEEIILAGSASDNEEGYTVYVSVNGGGHYPADGTTSWYTTHPLRLGMNTIRIYSMDMTGNISPVVIRKVVRSLSPTVRTVATWNLSTGAPFAPASAVVAGAGQTHVSLPSLAAASTTAGLNELWIFNPSNSNHAGLGSTETAALNTFVQNGGVLVFFDRCVTGAAAVIPGASGVSFINDLSAPQSDVDWVDPDHYAARFLVEGIEFATFDEGTHSSHGFMAWDTLPTGAVPVLTRDENSEHWVGAAYRHGAGGVFYAAMPADLYLNTPSSYPQITAGFNTLLTNAACGAVVATLREPRQIATWNVQLGQPSSEASILIEAAGHVHVPLPDLASASAEPGLQELWVFNPSNDGYAGLGSTEVAAFNSFVQNGGLLLFFDHCVAGAEAKIPGASSITFTRDVFSAQSNPDRVDLDASAPGGLIAGLTNATFDGGFFSSHGFMARATLPASAVPVLVREQNNAHVVAALYRHGTGGVLYLAMPGDYFLTSPYMRPVLTAGLNTLLTNAANGALAEALSTLPSGTPEIAVFDGNGTGGFEREDNAGVFVFGNVTSGASSGPRTFTLRNVGTDVLTGLAVTKGTNGNPGDFALTQPGVTTLSPGATTTFTVTFAPTTTGGRTGQIQIASNDANENPFDIVLSGNGVLPLLDWRQRHFASSANSGAGADANDHDKDGVANLMEYAFGLDPTATVSRQLPACQRNGANYGMTFTEPSGITGIVYGAEWSATMASGDWHAVPDTGSGANHVFSVPVGSQARLFMRLIISSQ